MVIMVIMVYFDLFAHDPVHHQYITREAFKLLKKSFPTQLNKMEIYIGNDEVWSGGSADGSFGALKVVSGAWLEDEYDIVYGYGLTKEPKFNQELDPSIILKIKQKWHNALTSITHFWDADKGESAQTDQSGNIFIDWPINDCVYWSFTIPENAMKKMRRYVYGDYDFWLYR